jgi:hypothetical protein
MKIIGKTISGYIIETIHVEISELCGNGKVDIGDEISISKSWEQLKRLKDHEYELERAASYMRKAADNIEHVVMPEIKEVITGVDQTLETKMEKDNA